ncbi:MAG TPA: excinuclease ABC subunit UvrA [bacterium]|nr:excinuclease ABC subunit UvrA [bacterium]
MRNITVKGARAHNLKNVDISIPRNSLTVFTGVSGSGKTSLAFDTIFAEGQRRYFETLSAYTRQFVAEMERPDVDLIEGLSPAISVDQKGMPTNPRSTVGTVTEIYDYMRLLFTAAGHPHCPDCGAAIKSSSPDAIARYLYEKHEGSFVVILAPLVVGRKGSYKDLFEKVAAKGFSRVRIDGEFQRVEEDMTLSRYKEHNIDLVVDRLDVSGDNKRRMEESLLICAREGRGSIIIHDRDSGKDFSFNSSSSCPGCGHASPKIQPRLFSFNHPTGACPNCGGLGLSEDADFSLIAPDPSLSIMEGAIAALPDSKNSYDFKLMVAALEEAGIDPWIPVGMLDDKAKNIIMQGSEGKRQKIRYRSPQGRWKFATAKFPGLSSIIKSKLDSTESERVRDKYRSFMRSGVCPECEGMRLRRESLAIKIGDKNIGELSSMPVRELATFLKQYKPDERERRIGAGLVNEALKRLGFLEDVGLSYLTLSRSAASLSGGEYQRVRLAAQIGSYLAGVTYVLDEPSVGLHPRDADRLLETLERLRDLGNTVIVIEHDESTMRRADSVVDVGPGAGRLGGEIVAFGTVADIIKEKKSLTGRYLSGDMRVCAQKRQRKKTGGDSLILKGASGNNLKNIDVKIPLGEFVCLTGVSGSGKSTLAIDTLCPAVKKELGLQHDNPLPYEKLEGAGAVKRVLLVDTSPIGKTPRSTPATYVGLFDDIRNLFAMLPESRARGYKNSRFSYNVKGGRCEACQGNGRQRIEMHFLPDVFITCPVCNGLRYNTETLEVYFKGKNIADVLNMTSEEALTYFGNIPKIARRLEIMRDIGLDYLLLGQPAPTLSTGEAQRIKLATELDSNGSNETLYLLDEPTTGLHFSDVQKLLDIINRLVERGNTVIVIEHNLDVIRCADWIIDLGPEGGNEGGRIIAEGPPEKIAKSKKFHTGAFLRKAMK